MERRHHHRAHEIIAVIKNIHPTNTHFLFDFIVQNHLYNIAVHPDGLPNCPTSSVSLYETKFSPLSLARYLQVGPSKSSPHKTTFFLPFLVYRITRDTTAIAFPLPSFQQLLLL